MDKIMISNSNFNNPDVASFNIEEDEDDEDVNKLDITSDKKK